MIEDSTTRDVYDLIAEFAKASNPSITDNEIQQQFPAPKTEEPISTETTINPSSEHVSATPLTQSTSDMNELNTKFEGLAAQLKETRKQIKKIKQAFSNTAAQPGSFSTEYYHREFHMLSNRLNEVFASNYKQIEDKFDALQRELYRGKQTSSADANPMTESFRLQHNMIVGLKAKIEKIHATFQEKTNPKEHYLTKEEFHEELRRLTARQQEKTSDEIKRSEQNILDTLRNLNQKETAQTQPPWLTWINLFILGLMVMYLLMQFISPSNRKQTFQPVEQEPNLKEKSVDLSIPTIDKEINNKAPQSSPIQIVTPSTTASLNKPPAISPKENIQEKLAHSTTSFNEDNMNQVTKEPELKQVKKSPTKKLSIQPLVKDSIASFSPAIVKEEVYFAED
ncbi:MAG: hypothetical protein KA198_06095 [Chitinophagaceae bacterium]|nr:hypothetical protein [Chitinophagaceae bacterium]